ncbi:MAG: hypothetical protein ABI175_00775, partial [Polyangiales bacterium]
MAARSGPSEQTSVDWRRLAADRNVAPAVAQGLWERANAAANEDPVKAEQAFKRMLEEAAAHDATPAVGKETLVDAKAPADPASLGPGKLTRVLEEQKAPAAAGKKDKDAASSAAAPAAPVPGGDTTPDAAKPTEKKTPEALKTEIATAVHAGQSAAALLAQSDQTTIVQALRELKETEGPGIVQKLISIAGDTIERLLATGAPDADAKAAEPIGEKTVQIDTGEEKHTAFADEAGVPMMASTPKPVTQRIEDWKKFISEQPPAVQAKVAGELARATQLTTTVADLTKKAKAGDAAAKSALTTTQQQLAASISSIGRQIPPEPEKKPAPPPPPVAAPPPPPPSASGAKPGSAPAPAPVPTTPAPTVPGKPAAPTAATPAAPPAPVAKPPPDPAAIKMADMQLLAMFRLTGNKVPVAIAKLGDQERIDESAKTAPELRKQHFPTFESLTSELPVDKVTQLDMEVGFEKGGEKLPAAFKQQVHDAFVADTYPAAINFDVLLNNVAKGGGPAGPYMMRGKPLAAADFDAAVPGDQSLARVMNVDAAFTQFLNKADAEAAFVAKYPGATPSSEELTAFVLTEAQSNASDAVRRYVSPKIVDNPSWMFPEPDIKSDAVFSQYCDLLGLYANWSPRGHMRMVVKRSAVSTKIANQQLRKPTVFDGMQSPLWMQRNNRDHNWGKTGGGIRQALMKVDWADIDQGKWALTVIDPKYAAVLNAAKAKAAKKATPAANKTIDDHEKAMTAKVATAQGAQRVEDAKAPAAPAAPNAAAPAPTAAPVAPPIAAATTAAPAVAKNDNEHADEHAAAPTPVAAVPAAPPAPTPPPLPAAP